MLSFPVNVSAADAQTVTVRYATADETATAPTDYAAASGTIALKPGAKTKTITVAVTGDRVLEPSETLTGARGGAQGSSRATSLARAHSQGGRERRTIRLP
jgi:hypothetical protein